MCHRVILLATLGIVIGSWSSAIAGPPQETQPLWPPPNVPPIVPSVTTEPEPTNFADDPLLAELEDEFVNQPTPELSDLDLGDSAAPPARDPFDVELPPEDIVPLVGAPWAYHSCQGITPLQTSQMVLERNLGRPLRIVRDDTAGLSYHIYDRPNARLAVGISTGVVVMVDAFPKLPLALGGAIEEFELSTPVKVPKLAPVALRGPPLPAGEEYFRCGHNVVAMTQPGTGQNEGDLVTRIRFHAWKTGRYGSDSDDQFGQLPPKFVLEPSGPFGER